MVERDVLNTEAGGGDFQTRCDEVGLEQSRVASWWLVWRHSTPQKPRHEPDEPSTREMRGNQRHDICLYFWTICAVPLSSESNSIGGFYKFLLVLLQSA